MKPSAACCAILALPLSATDAEAAVERLLRRCLGPQAAAFTLNAMPAMEGRDVFAYEARGGRVNVWGSSPVAQARGAYADLADHAGAQITWSGARLPQGRLPDAPLTRVASPYRYRYTLNVVTFGYSAAYWDWPRWERELDWMALHGVNFVLAPLGFEAILDRVFAAEGLTEAERDAFFTSPAYAPWNRMGNIIGWGGGRPKGWFKAQVALQHRILDRMRELGITPVAPAFAGFVPPALARLHPGLELKTMPWGDFEPRLLGPILAPDHPLFARLGEAVVRAWQKEFGRADFFLADSFNEMELPLPADPAAAAKLLGEYGRKVFQPIAAAAPHATWVMQGWTFGYMPDYWTPERLKALISQVPDEKLLILDMANDYFNPTQPCMVYKPAPYLYDTFPGWFGKRWIYSVIPNMGGKVAWTGFLDFYAQDAPRALASRNRGRLEGFGWAPEGIENNEVLYELLADMGWRTEGVNLDAWLERYARNRYGACPPEMKRAWGLLRKSVYGSFTDHPSFGWQTRPKDHPKGSANHDPAFFEAVDAFLACAQKLGGSALYRAGALELSAFVLGWRAEEAFQRAGGAQDATLRDREAEAGLRLLDAIDRLLASHPLDRLERWTALARRHGATPAERQACERDALNLLTLWGGGNHDYAKRVWSGLIRDFYAPRWRAWFDAKRAGTPFDHAAWEAQWLRTYRASPARPYADPLKAALLLVRNP